MKGSSNQNILCSNRVPAVVGQATHLRDISLTICLQTQATVPFSVQRVPKEMSPARSHGFLLDYSQGTQNPRTSTQFLDDVVSFIPQRRLMELSNYFSRILLELIYYLSNHSSIPYVIHLTCPSVNSLIYPFIHLSICPSTYSSIFFFSD